MEPGFTLSRPTLGGGGLRRLVAHFDWPLLLLVAAISGIGLLNLYSATAATDHGRLFDKQVVAMVIGCALFFAATAVDYRVLLRVAWIGLALAIVLIVVVQFAGVVVKGARRWLDFGVAQFQPSELAKLAIIVAMARFAHDETQGELPSVDVTTRLIALAFPIGLIGLQPDLGSAVLLGLIAGSVGLLALRNLKPVVAGLGVTVLAVPLLWNHMHEYQRQRILAFLDPGADPTGAGWHTQQSIFAVGSGRLTGKGFLNGTQNQFNFLPEHWTDFPFSVWAEEWGFLGCLVLIALYAALILWIVHVAMKARDHFGTVICLGVAAMLFWHALVNISMVLGIAPVVGVTLPLVSYGGSSVVTMLFGLGLVSSVSLRRHGH